MPDPTPRPDVPDELLSLARGGLPWDAFSVLQNEDQDIDGALRAIVAAVVPEIERRAVETERTAIISGIKHYFSPVEDDLWDDVQTLIGRIERGEYGARKERR